MRYQIFKIGLSIVSLLPAIALTLGAINDELGANPIEVLTRDTGEWALRFLLITLAVSPLRLSVGWHFLAAVRRMLGLYSFFYAVIHMLLYLWLDQFFDLSDIIEDVIERPFITVGFISFLALIPLALTSNDGMIKRLGTQRWNKLHRLVYYIAIGGVVHFYMLVKKDITEPLVYIALLAVLLGIRLYRYSRRTWISV
ncbi:MAG: sulfoxide reductase heme-binding subunit YedZ [Gammaproteobacteria bacterium]|jgi:sulfoxide reductase heme-binding subunit YedZ|nr:sulfoxide reductase heme-binding subunit YedZ [Gammaproteobacteria bacterium]